jgi:hypothetical protein
MTTVKVTRSDMIAALTRHELEWIYGGVCREELDGAVEFFAKGGFIDWSDDKLIRKYREDIAPEDAEVVLEV